MSINKFWREQWIAKVYASAVELFHLSRKEPENAETPLSDLARQCANTVFAENAGTIVGDKEVVARAFMQKCREGFAYEIGKALVEDAQSSIAAHQTQEARVS